MKELRILIFLIIALNFRAHPGCAQIMEEDALTQFVSAGMSYKDGHYEDAIGKYDAIIEGGRQSGAVYYNLGNSYFRDGDLGRAILNYERARRIIPRDSDLNFNHHYVSVRVDRYGDGETISYLKQVVRSYIDFYTIDEMVLIVIGAFFILGAFILAALYLSWSRPFTQGVIIFLILIIVLYSSGLGFKFQDKKNLAVVLDPSESYFEPRDDSTVHYKLSEGMKIRILRSELGWVKIKRLDGKAGWVPSDVLDRI